LHAILTPQYNEYAIFMLIDIPKSQQNVMKNDQKKYQL
jgi:hypothetical protein